jgi:hypothetical protein
MWSLNLPECGAKNQVFCDLLTLSLKAFNRKVREERKSN